MQFGRLRILGVTVAAALLLPLVGQGLSAFSDLGGHWAASAVAALQARGLVSGYPDGSFDPARALTRGEMAKLLAVMLDQEPEARALAGVGTRFSDVSGRHWAAGYVEVLAELNLVRGDALGAFEPDRSVTRSELAVLLARAAGLENTPPDPQALQYRDQALIPVWALGAVAAGTRTGLLTGDDTGNFRPADGVSRAEAAAAMLRLLAYRGSAFQMVGTLLSYDGAMRRLTLRDSTGQVRTVVLSSDAVVFRQGVPVQAAELLAGDQAWSYMGADGLVRYVDARFQATLGTQARVSDNQLIFLRGTALVGLNVQAGALVFVNGRPATLRQVDGAPQVYVGLDASTGEARLIDAVFYQNAGAVRVVDPQQNTLAITQQDGLRRDYTVALDAMIFRNGALVTLKDLSPGDLVLVQPDASGKLVFLQAERQPG